MFGFIRTPIKKEWSFIAILALVVICIVLLPLVTGALSARNVHFTWLPILNNGDVISYLDLLWQVKDGHFLFNNGLTVEPNPHVLVRPSFLVLGLLGRMFYLSPNTTYALGLALYAAGLAVVVYFFVAQFFVSVSARRTASVLLLFSGGLGFLHFLTRSSAHPIGTSISLDVVSPGISTFLGYMNGTHFTWVLALLLLLVVFLVKRTKRPVTQYFLLASISAAIALEHPFDIPTVAWITALSFFIALIFKRAPLAQLKKAFFIALGLGLAVGQIYLAVNASPVFQDWKERNISRPKSAAGLLFSYGLLIIFGLYGFYKKRKFAEGYFFLFWPVGQVLIMYSRIFSFSGRITEGLQFPIAMLAAIGLLSLPIKAVLRWILVMLLCLSPACYLLYYTGVYRNNYSLDKVKERQSSKFYTYPNDYAVAAEWIRKNTNPESVIVCAMENGSTIVSLTGRRILLFHWLVAVEPGKKRKAILSFFSGRQTAESLQEEFKAEYIWISREEKQNYIEPSGTTVEKVVNGRPPVFATDLVEIYKI